MFAGAVRETVLSVPAVIRRVNAEFVPVAVTAARLHQQGDDEEGRLLRAIGRSGPAPQGLCVLNAGGQVLDWALMFDSDDSVLAFLDHSLKRFREHPDARQPLVTERYMRFPSQKLEDVQSEAQSQPVAERHPAGNRCPGKMRFPQGTLIARVVGRTLDADGQLSTDTVHQEHYAQDRFLVTAAIQEALARAFADAEARRVRIPDEFARLCVTYAYLGQIDVRPLSHPLGVPGDLKRCEFWAQKIGGGSRSSLLRVEGRSEVASGELARRGDGASFRHEVQLTWAGFIRMTGTRMTRLLLSARGTEKLKWRSEGIAAAAKSENAVACLPAGRPIDLACGVRYGIIGEPVPADEVGGGEVSVADALAQAPVPDLGRQLMAALGPPFAVFLPAVQEDLKLSDEQKQKLQQHEMAAARGFQQFMQEAQSLPQGKREKKFHAFRQETSNKLSVALADLLKPDQRKRLRQIALRQEGLFALGNPDVAAELKLSDAQKLKFMTTVQDMQQRFEALHQKAQSGGKPEGIQREAAKIREEQEARVAALLTGAQQKQWKAMVGKPLELEPIGGAKE